MKTCMMYPRSRKQDDHRLKQAVFQLCGSEWRHMHIYCCLLPGCGCDRMETLKLTRFHGKVKFAGILFCVAGVTILAFYEGPMFRSFNHHHLFQNGGGGGGSSAAGAGDTHSKKQWVLGIFLMTLSNVLAGLWTVLQVHSTLSISLSIYLSIPVSDCNSVARMNEPCTGAPDRGHVEADEHDAADLVGVAPGLPGGRCGGEGLLQVEAGLERRPRRHNLQRT
jgi:hypothetical protein